VISVTDHAKQMLKDILIAMEADLDDGLRLMPSSDGAFVLTLGKQMSGDQVVEHEGFMVLLIGIEYFGFLNGRTVDCEATEDGEVLLVR
jgi:hypothetical protein